MDMNEYQELAAETATYPGRGAFMGLIYTILGLNGEAGEVAEKLKKIVRDKNRIIDHEFNLAVKKELGDVLWYVSQCALELGYTLEEVAEGNVEKLSGRKARGVLGGSGDDR